MQCNSTQQKKSHFYIIAQNRQNNWCHKSEHWFILGRKKERTGGELLGTGNFLSLYLGISYVMFSLWENKNKHTHIDPSLAFYCLPTYVQISKPTKQDCNQ